MQVQSDVNLSMVADDSYHPSTVTMFNLDTVFNAQIMEFDSGGLGIGGTEVKLMNNRRSFQCSWNTDDTQCGQVCVQRIF